MKRDIKDAHKRITRLYNHVTQLEDKVSQQEGRITNLQAGLTPPTEDIPDPPTHIPDGYRESRDEVFTALLTEYVKSLGSVLFPLPGVTPPGSGATPETVTSDWMDRYLAARNTVHLKVKQ